MKFSSYERSMFISASVLLFICSIRVLLGNSGSEEALLAGVVGLFIIAEAIRHVVIAVARITQELTSVAASLRTLAVECSNTEQESSSKQTSEATE